jgi:hypothetical protein
MTKAPHSSIVFSKAATWLMYLALIVAAGLFFQLIAPGVHPHVGHRSVGVGVPAFLVPVIGCFLLCLLVAGAIIGLRAWFLYVGPWWRRQHGA